MQTSQAPISERYERQIKLENWGAAAQRKIGAAHVFVAGAGGLGSPAALYLAAAGVGRLTLCDGDEIRLHNLNRQVLYREDWLGEPKAAHAGQVLQAFNRSIDVQAYPEYLAADNLARLVGQPDVVIDALDNYPSRFLLNRYCVDHGIPLVHASIWGLNAMVTFLHPPQAPCLRCLVPQLPVETAYPAVGAVCGIAGCTQALEALKFITGIGELLTNRMLIIDGEELSFEIMQVARQPDCPDCGQLAG
ncbi:MAG: HesA/MoeB/ThiF family protein [Anaerolineales bacterium]|jgi:adenylyltransferase/sulfurtransferase